MLKNYEIGSITAAGARMTIFGTLVLLFLMGAAPQSSSQSLSRQPSSSTQSSSFCGCLGFDAAVNGLAQLRAAKWRGVDRTEIRKLWPRVPLLPCEPSTAQPGISAAADYLARCCETCELCGGVAFDDAFGQRATSSGLRLVDIWLARPTFMASNKILRSLATAALPVSISSKPTSTSHFESRIIDGYSWDADGARYQMRVDAIASGSVWLGHFQVGRCTPRGPAIRAQAEGASAQGTSLSLSHATQCLREDLACWKAELDQIWPKLRSLAAGRTIAAIDIELEDCFGGSTAFQVTRSKDGQWSGLWRPKTP